MKFMYFRTVLLPANILTGQNEISRKYAVVSEGNFQPIILFIQLQNTYLLQLQKYS